MPYTVGNTVAHNVHHMFCYTYHRVPSSGALWKRLWPLQCICIHFKLQPIHNHPPCVGLLGSLQLSAHKGLKAVHDNPISVCFPCALELSTPSVSALLLG